LTKGGASDCFLTSQKIRTEKSSTWISHRLSGEFLREEKKNKSA